MLAMLRKEACSGMLEDLAHVVTKYCLADALTKSSAKADELTTAIKSGRLPFVDVHPPFRSLMEHRAYLIDWLKKSIKEGPHVSAVLGIPLELITNRTTHFVLEA